MKNSRNNVTFSINFNYFFRKARVVKCYKVFKSWINGKFCKSIYSLIYIYPTVIKSKFVYYEVHQRTCQPASCLKKTAIIQQVTKPLLVQKHPFVAELGRRLSKPLIILDYWRNPQD